MVANAEKVLQVEKQNEVGLKYSDCMIPIIFTCDKCKTKHKMQDGYTDLVHPELHFMNPKAYEMFCFKCSKGDHFD